MRTRYIAVACIGLALSACGTDPATEPEAPAPNLANVGETVGSKLIIAKGSLTWGTTVYPTAVLTYDQAMDASDMGSNPGIELWTSDALSRRLARSNDNNGQWDYDIAGAYFSGGVAMVFGTRTGSHGPQGRVWKSSGTYYFLVQEAAAYDCSGDQVGGGFGATDPLDIFAEDRLQYGPFSLIKGVTTYPAAVVTYDRAMDRMDGGSNPGIEVWADAAKASRLYRSNDNNGQWDYQVDCVYSSGGVIRVVGARSPNGGTSWNPFLWVTEGGSFLIGYSQ